VLDKKLWGYTYYNLGDRGISEYNQSNFVCMTCHQDMRNQEAILYVIQSNSLPELRRK
jgi:hypothetical protein